MAAAMRKHVISAALLVAGLLPGLSACQVFTAHDKVSDPDPGQARAARGQLGSKQEAHPEKSADLHGGAKQPAAFPGHPEVADAVKETATAAHILIRYVGTTRAGPEVTRSKEAARKLADQVAAKAKAKGANFAALADQYTEDPSGKGRGGQLGTFERNRMVPPFDAATFALRPGETSDVVETAFGFHVIHREK